MMLSSSFLNVGPYVPLPSVTGKLVGSNPSGLGQFDQSDIDDEKIKSIADGLLESNGGGMHTAIESGLSLFGKAQELYVNSKDSRLLRYLAEIELAKQTGKTEIFLGDENGIGKTSKYFSGPLKMANWLPGSTWVSTAIIMLVSSRVVTTLEEGPCLGWMARSMKEIFPKDSLMERV